MEKKIHFENHFTARVVEILFPEGYEVLKREDLSDLKNQWIMNLKHWHSPYTCVFDLVHFHLHPELKGEFESLIKFFHSFFMRKIIGFCDNLAHWNDIGFQVVLGYENALSQTGLAREKNTEKKATDIRSSIQIDNDFNAHVLEINFATKTHFATADDVNILKSKLQNILMLWHTPYSVVINCLNCTFAPETKEAFQKLERFLMSFFCRCIIGYAPSAEDRSSYPFQTYRSRHLAVANLKKENIQLKNKTRCSAR